MNLKERTECPGNICFGDKDFDSVRNIDERLNCGIVSKGRVKQTAGD